MALTVEDGSVVANADAYVETSYVDTYATDYMNNSNWASLTDSVKERNIRRATQYIDGNFGNKFGGYRHDEDQELEWPREYAYRNGTYLIDDSTIPKEVKQAVAELAVKLASSDLSDLFTDVEQTQSMFMTRSKLGDLEEEIRYSNPIWKRQFEALRTILAPLINIGRVERQQKGKIMANALYDLGREGFLAGDIDWDADNIKIGLWDSADYTPNLSTDNDYADVDAGARVATSANLSSKTTTAGVADAADVTFSSVTGDVSEYIGCFQDTGTESTSRLIFLIDTATGLPVTPNGGDITVSWDDGANKIFKLQTIIGTPVYYTIYWRTV